VKGGNGAVILTSLQKQSKVFKSYQKLPKLTGAFKHLLLGLPDARESEADRISPEANNKNVIRAGGSTSYIPQRLVNSQDCYLWVVDL